MLAKRFVVALTAFAMALGGPALAQVQTVDPDRAIDGDLGPDGQLPPVSGDPYARDLPASDPVPAPAPYRAPPIRTAPDVVTVPPVAETEAAPAPSQMPVADEKTYERGDVLSAAESVFGEGAEGVARLIEDILRDQGEPNAYIVGREAGGALGVGLRYGGGTLHHKVEGERRVFWTGPSVGFDAGASGGSTFVLIYNLWDSQELFERYPAGEGQAYIAAGLNASYMRKGDVVLIPIRMGVGARLGVNAGYLKFSEKQRWLPF